MMKINYQDIEQFILSLKNKASVFSIGQSHLGRDIWCVKVGQARGPAVLIQYAIHAREHITAFLGLRHIIDAINCPPSCGSLYFVPVLNPDGVALCLDGVDSVRSDNLATSDKSVGSGEALRRWLAEINGSADFSLFKANVRGVDLNVNFPAQWGKGAQNVFHAASENFVGKYPASESEVRAIMELTIEVKPQMTISYHCKGEEIYYNFFQPKHDLRRDLNIANEFKNLTGYRPVFLHDSAGGYKDWCIQEFKIPAFTIEVGNDNLPHPIQIGHLNEIYEKNKLIPSKALEICRTQLFR